MAPRMHNSFAVLALCGLVEEITTASSRTDEQAIDSNVSYKRPKKGKRTKKARKPRPVLPPVAESASPGSTAQASAGPSCIKFDDVRNFIYLVLAVVLVINLLVPPGVRPPTPKPLGAAKHPVVIVPGFITSHLEVWQGRPCAAAAGRARVWGGLGMIKFMTKPSCWMQHLSLDSSGLDPPGIKVRAVQGIQGAQDFLPAYTIWGKVLSALAAVGYDTANLAVLPYDWRLGMPQMEARDAWFSTTRSTIEQMVQRTGHKAVLMSHSYGENVARTFLHWAEAQHPGWLEAHVEAHTAVAGPSLGLPTALPLILSGEMADTVGFGALSTGGFDAWLPRPKRKAMFRSWTSLQGLLPHGGPKVWGNASWAPDDSTATRRAGLSVGAVVKTKTAPKFTAGTDTQATLDMGQAVQLALAAVGSDLHRDVPLMLQVGSAHGGNHTIKLPKLPNPLTTPLPNAPSLKLYYLYGVGIPTERAYHFKALTGRQRTIDTQAADSTAGLANGVQFSDGDVTVPLLSLGGLSRGAWRSKRLNPAGIQVVTKEYQHQPASALTDLRGGPATAKHVDILINHEVLSDLVSIATGAGHTVHSRVHSAIDRIVSGIPWEDRHGWY